MKLLSDTNRFYLLLSGKHKGVAFSDNNGSISIPLVTLVALAGLVSQALLGVIQRSAFGRVSQGRNINLVDKMLTLARL